jgi:ribosomal protein L30E
MKETTIEQLKKLAEEKKIIFGSSDTIRKLKKGKIKKVFLASNIPTIIEEDIKHNASIDKIDIEKTTLANDELSMVFKRIHPLLAIGVLKE